MSNLEALRQGLVGEGPRAGWRETIGARIAEVEDGRAVVELDVHAGHRHEGGVVQGGIITQIADAAMGMSLMTRQDQGMANTTIELKINFLRAVRKGRLSAEARVVKAGSALGYVECDVVDENGKLIAKSNSTCLVLRGEKAAGR